MSIKLIQKFKSLLAQTLPRYRLDKCSRLPEWRLLLIAHSTLGLANVGMYLIVKYPIPVCSNLLWVSCKRLGHLVSVSVALRLPFSLWWHLSAAMKRKSLLPNVRIWLKYMSIMNACYMYGSRS